MGSGARQPRDIRNWGGNFLTEVPDDGKVYGRTHGEWVEDEDGAVYELIEDITIEEAVQGSTHCY